MIDIHSHILPGIDDGARDMDESLAMLNAAAQNETASIVATPHVGRGFCPSWSAIIDGCEILQTAARKQGLSIAVIPGAEVSLAADVFCNAAGPGPYCIGQGRYMLVELPFISAPIYIEGILYGLLQKGIIPVLAHPERHPQLTDDYRLMREWVRQGGIVQINATSLSGRHSSASMAAATQWLTEGLVHCVGSDAHSVFTRSPKLIREQAIIRELVGPAAANEILVSNPEKILSSQTIRSHVQSTCIALGG